MSNLIKHAQEELNRLFGDKGPYDGMVKEDVLELIEVFSRQEHSGGSAGLVTSLLNKLMRFQSLSPLTGEDSEWVEVGPNVFQNNRCSAVFKDGEAYYLDGNVFVNQYGQAFTGEYSPTLVEFPWSPPEKINYVKVFQRDATQD